MIVLAFATGSLLSAQSQDAYLPPDQQQQQPYQQQPPQLEEQPYQQSPQYGPAQQGTAFSHDELRNLAAPIALYPDTLLSQVLVASTYPQEVADAADWMQQNRFLRGRELMTAAQQQNWDPSVQALVAFPDVLTRLSADVQWLTDLGNAFLAQQADVMNAIQDLRAEARGAGMLRGSPRFQVNTETQGARTVIEIAPANPQIIYVPSYDPYAVWGPPVYGAYPAVPCVAGSVFGAVVTAVADIAGLLPGFGGWLGPRSWGWALGWLANALFVNNGFFHSFGFHWGGGAGGTAVWAHDWHHRLGVPYGRRDSVAYWHRGAGPGHAGWHNFSPRNEGGRTLGGYRGSGRGGFDHARENGSRSFNNRSERGREGYANWNTARSFASSRSYQSRPSASGFAHFPAARSAEPSRSITATRSRSETRSFSPGPHTARGSESRTNERGHYSARSSSGRSFNERSYSARSYSPRSSFEQSSRRESSRSFRQSSGSRRSSSHAPKAAHYSAPKTPKAPKMAKAHGGGHSSGGHSSKSHRG